MFCRFCSKKGASSIMQFEDTADSFLPKDTDCRCYQTAIIYFLILKVGKINQKSFVSQNFLIFSQLKKRMKMKERLSMNKCQFSSRYQGEWLILPI